MGRKKRLMNFFLFIYVLGFDGDYCERNIDECVGNGCLNNATCVDEIDGYRYEHS